MKYIIPLLIVMIFLVAACASEEPLPAPGEDNDENMANDPNMASSGVTRSVTDVGDGVYEVSLKVDLPEGAKFYLIDESLPTEAQLIESSTASTEDPGHLKWLFIDGMGDAVESGTFVYKVELPEGNTDAISGIYYIDGMTEEANIPNI